MAERTFPDPAHLLRRFAAPVGLAAIGALVAGSVTLLIQRARRPALPRMSDEWLQSHDWYSDYERWREY